MGHKMLKAAAGAAALLSLGAGVGAASAATSPGAGPAWRSVGQSGVGGEVTAVTTVVYSGGKVAEFAFYFHGTKPSLYARTGNGSWAKDPIPVAKAYEVVTAAKAIGPDEVLMFTRTPDGHSRVLKMVGHHQKTRGGTSYWRTWSVLHTFGAEIGSASVLSASNVWVFGTSFQGGGSLGVWHFNGKSWTRVAKGFTDGSAQSSKDVWAASGTTLEHWNGSRWTATSVAGLLSSRNATVSTIYTGNSNAPYAVVSENPKATGGGGPVVVLEYNGRAWKRVASYPTGGAVEGAAAADGASGLWFAVNRSQGRAGALLHYNNHAHSLTAASVPGLNDPLGSAVSSIAQIGGSTRELAGGYTIKQGGDPFVAKVWYLS